MHALEQRAPFVHGPAPHLCRLFSSMRVSGRLPTSLLRKSSLRRHDQRRRCSSRYAPCEDTQPQPWLSSLSMNRGPTALRCLRRCSGLIVRANLSVVVRATKRQAAILTQSVFSSILLLAFACLQRKPALESADSLTPSCCLSAAGCAGAARELLPASRDVRRRQRR